MKTITSLIFPFFLFLQQLCKGEKVLICISFFSALLFSSQVLRANLSVPHPVPCQRGRIEGYPVEATDKGSGYGKDSNWNT